MSAKRPTPTMGTASPAKNLITKKSNNNPTPNKENFKKIDEEMTKIPQFGTTEWCAAQEQCLNTLKAATSEYICLDCNNAAHATCLFINEDEQRCFVCNELYDEGDQGQVNRSVHSSEYDTDYQNDPVIPKTKQSSSEEEELTFTNDNDNDNMMEISQRIQMLFYLTNHT
jgi:hypothetical protein